MKNIKSLKPVPAAKTSPETQNAPGFPRSRMRRNRVQDWTRRLVAENAVTVNDLIWPVFVLEGKNIEEPIASMPGVSRWSLDVLVKQAERAAKLGIPALAVFPVVAGDKKN